VAVSFFKWKGEESKGMPENCEGRKIKEQVNVMLVPLLTINNLVAAMYLRKGAVQLVL
jgi:hypothetical protein